MRSLSVVLVMLTLLACTSSRTVAETDLALQHLNELIESKQIEFIPNAASPMLSSGMIAISNGGLLVPGSNVSRIDISGTSSFLKIATDTISAQLSYYGERQMGGGYNSSSGIDFEGVPKNYEVRKNTKKNYYTVQFTISEQSENYQVWLNLFPDLSGTLSINSSQRHPITYYGALKKGKSQ